MLGVFGFATATAKLAQRGWRRDHCGKSTNPTPSRREAIIAQLTKDRDALIKSKREIKMKFDAVESYLVDHTRVRIGVPPTLPLPSSWLFDSLIVERETLPVPL